MDLVDRVYDGTDRFPPNERFGLTSQLRRSAVSIPSNIAEGSGRGGDREFCRYLGIAYGSLMEVETQLEISKRRGYLPQEMFQVLMAQSSELAKMLNGLKNACSRE